MVRNFRLKNHTHFTLEYKSTGVLSVTIDEVNSVDNLTVEEDNNPFDGHFIIDYSNVENLTQIKKKAKKLKNLAVKRGWTHKED